MNKVIWCYAEGKTGNWEAICLDFDLAVQGKSFDEVYRELNVAISMYLEYTNKLLKEDQRRFLGRKAPAGLRLNAIVTLLLPIIFEYYDDSMGRVSYFAHRTV